MPIAPVAFNYADTDDPDLERFDMVVAGRVGATVRPFYRRLVNEGRRVVQYVNFTDVNGPRYSELDELFSRTSHALPYSNWSGHRVGDLRSAAFRDHLIDEAFPRALAHEAITDLFVDVFGLRLWSGAWGQMQAAGVASDWTKGMIEMRDRVGEVRDRERPGARIWANGTHPDGHRALCPVVEHHSVGEIPYWRGYLDPARWDSTPEQPTGLIIAWNMGEWSAWRGVPGIGAFGAQATYTYAPSEAIPYTQMLPRSTAAPTPAPPPTTPRLPKPGRPVGLTATPSGSGQVTLIWEARPLAEAVIDHQVYVDGRRLPQDVLGTLYEVSGLSDGTAYEFRVSAENPSGFGPWSDLVTATPVPDAPPPVEEPPPGKPSDADVHAAAIARIDATLNQLGSAILDLDEFAESQGLSLQASRASLEAAKAMLAPPVPVGV